MTALSLTNPTPGTTADANLIASNNSAILAVINGGLDNSNLVAGAGILLSKLAGYPADATKFARGDGTWAAASSLVSVGTALPVSPTDGQPFILTDSTTTPTFAWALQYLAAASKWLFSGGSPMYSSVITSEGTSSATYVALTTAGPSLTVPRTGDYYVTVGSQQSGVNVSQSFHSFDVGGTGAIDNDSCGMASSGSAGTNNTNPSVTMTSKKTGIAAGTALVSKYKSDGTHAVNWTRRWIEVLPIAVT